MKVPHGVAVALLVVLAGCGGFLGGGGAGTPESTTQPSVVMGTPSPTASPTPTATPSPTPTPLPGSYTTRTVTNETLGATFDLTGNKGALRSFLMANITGLRITRGQVLQCARTTPFVATSTNKSVADVTATMEYDPEMLPENASESELSVFVYNRTVNFYLEMETTVDAENDTVTATEISPGQTFTRETENGTEQVAPKLDGTRLDNAFVVMHAPTWWEAVNTRELPSQCETNTPTPTPTNGTGTATTN